MKKTLISAAIVAAVTFTQAANAQSASATFTATARIVPKIAIAKSVDMNFGDVVAGASAGTVQLNTDGTRVPGGGTSLSNGATATAASFNVTGQGSATYAITLPASATVASGANTMNVATFVSNPSGTGVLTVGGSQTLLLGATLSVGAAQATGTYTNNSFSISVNYN